MTYKMGYRSIPAWVVKSLAMKDEATIKQSLFTEEFTSDLYRFFGSVKWTAYNIENNNIRIEVVYD